MVQLADQSQRHDLDGLARGVVHMAQTLQGTGHFFMGGVLAVLDEVHDGGLHVQAAQPLPENVHFLVHDLGGFLSLVATGGQVLFHHFLEVVDIVKVDVVQAVDVGVDVAGDGDVDEEHGPVLARLEHAADVTGTDDGIRRTGGRDDDVHLRQMGGQGFKRQGPAIELTCQFLTARERTVGHQDLVHTGLEQVGGGQFGHLTGAHQHGLVVLHLAEDALGQFHGGIADGHGAGGHGGLGAHAFGHGERLVQ